MNSKEGRIKMQDGRDGDRLDNALQYTLVCPYLGNPLFPSLQHSTSSVIRAQPKDAGVHQSSIIGFLAINPLEGGLISNQR